MRDALYRHKMIAGELNSSVNESADSEMARQKLVGMAHPVVRAHHRTIVACERELSASLST